MQIGIALAGGGASGGAHAGVLQALLEERVPLHAASGTSSGAVVAGLFAAGLTVERMLQLLPTLTKRHIDLDANALTRLLRRQPLEGVVKGDRLQSFLRQHIGSIALCDVTLPLAIAATDLQTGGEVVFASRDCPAPLVHSVGLAEGNPLWTTVHSAPLALAIRASLGIPLVFKPVLYKDLILSDGGLVDNCPVAPLRALATDFVIAVDTITPFLRYEDRLPLHFRHMIAQMINIGLARHAATASLQADLFLTPSVGPIGALDFPRLQSVADQGYEYTRSHMPAIRRALSQAQEKWEHKWSRSGSGESIGG